MKQRPTRATRTDTLFPYMTHFRSVAIHFEVQGLEYFSRDPVLNLFGCKCSADDGILIAGQQDVQVKLHHIRMTEAALIGIFHHQGYIDRKSVVKGKSVSVRVALGGRRIIKKKNE